METANKEYGKITDKLYFYEDETDKVRYVADK